MARTVLLAAFFIGVTCVLADNSSSTTHIAPAATSSLHSAIVNASSFPPDQPVAPSINWMLKDGNDTCIMMTADIHVTIGYFNTSKKHRDYKIEASNSAVVQTKEPHMSYCTNNESLLTLRWDNKDPHSYYLSFMFEKDGKDWKLTKVDMTFNTTNNTDFMNINHTGVINASVSKEVASAKANESYRCNHEEKYTLGGVNKTFGISVEVDLSDLRVQAFSFKNQTAFGSERKCDADRGSGTNKIVPIAVGAALAGLVVIVLVAYLIGRFRSRKSSSYEPLS